MMNSMGKRQWENLIGQNEKQTKMYWINRNTSFKWETQNISAWNNQTCQLYSWGEVFLWKWKHGEISEASGGHRVSLTQPGAKCQAQLVPSALQGPESSPEKVYLLSKSRTEIFSPSCQAPFHHQQLYTQSMSWLCAFGNSCPGWKGWGLCP